MKSSMHIYFLFHSVPELTYRHLPDEDEYGTCRLSAIEEIFQSIDFYLDPFISLALWINE